MFEFIKRLFAKKTEVQLPEDLTSSVSELWSTDFSEDNKRFIEEIGDGYTTSFDNGFVLTLDRKDLFAWSVNQHYQYKDFRIEGVIDFTNMHAIVTDSESVAIGKKEQAGLGAYGIFFRYVNDLNYYSLLISDGGFFRFDVVFNGNQMPLLGWTAIPVLDQKYRKQIESNCVPFEIIASDTYFTIVINYQHAVTIEDDTIQSEGYTAFAAQNWATYETINAKLSFFSIDSREIQANAAHQQWNAIDDISYEKHIQIAESYAAISRAIPAIIEIKKAWKLKDPDVNSLLFAARLYMSQQLYDEANEVLLKALEQDGENIQVKEQYASMLYLASKYNDFDEFIAKNEDDVNKSIILSDLKAHVKAMQHDYENSIKYYLQAASLDKRQSQHYMNAALIYDALNEKEKACDTRIKAASIALQNSDFEAFSNISNILRSDKKTIAQDIAFKALCGRSDYYMGDVDKAKDELEDYVKLVQTTQGIQEKDAEAFFFLAVIYRDEGYSEEALELCKKAISCKPEEAIYYRTLAEIYIDLGHTEEADSSIEKALEYDKNDGWTYYLKARQLYVKDNLEESSSCIFSSLALLPEDLAVLKLYLEIMDKQGKFDQALPVVDAAAIHSGYGSEYRTDALHLVANFLRDKGQYEQAEKRYKEAIDLNGKDSLLLADYAQLCVNTDRVNEADELLSRSYPLNPPVKTFQTLACVAVKKGDFSRAEVTLRQALETFEDDENTVCSLLIDLGNLYLMLNKFDKAEDVVKELKKRENSERVTDFVKQIYEKTRESLSCSICNTTWFVPKNIPSTTTLTLTAQPPDDLPAGTCPDCGKTFCIACVKKTVDKDGRLKCPDCGKSLKLKDKRVIYILSNYMKGIVE